MKKVLAVVVTVLAVSAWSNLLADALVGHLYLGWIVVALGLTVLSVKAWRKPPREEE